MGGWQPRYSVISGHTLHWWMRVAVKPRRRFLVFIWNHLSLTESGAFRRTFMVPTADQLWPSREKFSEKPWQRRYQGTIDMVWQRSLSYDNSTLRIHSKWPGETKGLSFVFDISATSFFTFWHSTNVLWKPVHFWNKWIIPHKISHVFPCDLIS